MKLRNLRYPSKCRLFVVAAALIMMAAAYGGETFRFVHATDTHQLAFPEEIAEINALEPQPDFIVITGDLVPAHGNDPDDFKAYVEHVKRFRAPVYLLPGNHDYSTRDADTRPPHGRPKPWPDGVQNYLQHVGPNQFTFEHKGWRFIALDSQMRFEDYREWLMAALAEAPEDGRIVVFQHKDPEAPLVELLAAHRVSALFHGHTHATRLIRKDGLKVFSTPPLTRPPLDTNSRGFRIVSLKADKLESRMRWSGISAQLSIVSPGLGVLPRDQGDILATWYDTSARGRRLEFQMDDGLWQAMECVGGWLYRGRFHQAPDMQVKPHVLRVRAVGDQGPLAERVSRSVDSDIPGNPILWASHAGGQTGHSSPVVSGGKVYIGVQDDDNGVNCGVVCFDALSGTRLWKATTDSSVNGSVVVWTPAFSEPMVFAVSVAGVAYGFDAETGTERWRHESGNALHSWLYNGPAVSDGILYFGGSTITTLDADTGREQWSTVLGAGREWGAATRSPQVNSRWVYGGARLDGLHALNRSTGETVWNSRLIGSRFPSPFVTEAKVFFAGGQNTLFALNADSGAPEWQASLGRLWAQSSPFVRDRVLVVGLEDAGLGAFCAETGAPLWVRRITMEPEIGTFGFRHRANLTVTSPIIHEQSVYIGLTDGGLYAFDLDTGEPLWSRDFGVPVLATPALHDNHVYVATCDGVVYCVEN